MIKDSINFVNFVSNIIIKMFYTVDPPFPKYKINSSILLKYICLLILTSVWFCNECYLKDASYITTNLYTKKIIHVWHLLKDFAQNKNVLVIHFQVLKITLTSIAILIPPSFLAYTAFNSWRFYCRPTKYFTYKCSLILTKLRNC